MQKGLLMNKFNKKNVKAWMRDNYRPHCDSITKEVNFTTLCEAAAEVFNQNFENGPLDDTDHWIWECPVEMFEL